MTRPSPRAGAAAGDAQAMTPRNDRGLTMVDTIIAIVLVGILVAVTYTSFRKYNAIQQLRYGATQVASSLREAEERAKAERTIYTIAFTASSSTYVITRSTGGFVDRGALPSGVTPQATATVTFTAFGQPDAAHTITLQNAAGTKTASVDAAGGITYQNP